MEPVPVSPVAYASPPTAGDAPPVGVRTTVAAAWLILLLAVTASAFDAFTTAQAQVGYVGQFLARYGSPLDTLDRLLRWTVGPVVSAALFGMFAAAALYHWPRQRLHWAATVPLAAAVWAYFNPLLAWSRSTGNFGSPTPIAPIVLLAAIQCGSVYAGTRCGRPAARWLANQLLPPSLRSALVVLWR